MPGSSPSISIPEYHASHQSVVGPQLTGGPPRANRSICYPDHVQHPIPICGPERLLGPSIYTTAATVRRSDCCYDLLTEW